MVNLSDEDEYITADMVRAHGKTIQITGDCKSQTFEQHQRTVFVWPIKFVKDDFGPKKWIANKTTQKRMRKAWGDNTEKWPYPETYVELKILTMLVGGNEKEVLFGTVSDYGKRTKLGAKK